MNAPFPLSCSAAVLLVLMMLVASARPPVPSALLLMAVALFVLLGFVFFGRLRFDELLDEHHEEDPSKP